MRMRLLPLPFDSVFTTRKRPISSVRVDVGAAVGLLVEPDDVDDADLLHRLGDHVDLRADEVLVLDRGLARQERHLDRTGGGDLVVDQLLDARPEAFGQRVELEVHPRRQRLHVAAGDGRAPLVPDHAAQHVQRGVRAHQRVTAIPVDLDAHAVARPRASARRRCARRCRLPCGHRRHGRHRASRCRRAGRRRSGRGRCGRARRGRPRRPRPSRRSPQVGIPQVEQFCFHCMSFCLVAPPSPVRGLRSARVPFPISGGKHMRHRKRLQVLALLVGGDPAGGGVQQRQEVDDRCSVERGEQRWLPSQARRAPSRACEGRRLWSTCPLTSRRSSSSQGLDLQNTYNYGAESYDATVVIALATEAAGTDGIDMAKQINQVTRNGTKCTTYQQCDQLIKGGTKDIDYDGVSGSLEFSGNGEPTVASYGVQEFNSPGQDRRRRRRCSRRRRHRPRPTSPRCRSKAHAPATAR